MEKYRDIFNNNISIFIKYISIFNNNISIFIKYRDIFNKNGYVVIKNFLVKRMLLKLKNMLMN